MRWLKIAAIALGAITLIGSILWFSGVATFCGPGSTPGPSISDFFKIKGC